jgi:iron-sulfur cluster repair protein YtfE (RIC family)
VNINTERVNDMITVHDKPTLPPIEPSESLNAIVARDPRALEVLNSYGLDTCCGGSLRLDTAVELHGLRLSTVLAALHATWDIEP